MNVIKTTILRNNLADALKKVNKDKDYLLISNRGKINSVIVDIDYFEDLLESTNQKYLDSIKEARELAKRGEFFTHEEAVVYTNNALKDIKKLDAVTKKRISKKLILFSSNPLKLSKRSTDNSIGSYRWRVGNFRIILDLRKNNIEVLRIRHRRDVYK